MNVFKYCLVMLMLLNIVWFYVQDLYIFYDVFEDMVYYQIDGKVVVQLVVKKGQQVILYVFNYNDYIYDLELEIEVEDFNVFVLGSFLFGGGSSGFVLVQFRSLIGGMGGMGFGLDSICIVDQGSGMVDQVNVFIVIKVMARWFVSYLQVMEDIESEIQEFNGYLNKELQSQVF